MFRIHDFTHAARISELLRGLQDGHFPVRWTSNFGYGYGMPLFEFYAPLPFYVGAFFYWLGLSLVPVVKLLYVICSVFTFWGMYKLASRLFGRTGGILSAVVLTLAPYRAVNLFVRGSLSEAWGIMAIPWVLLGIVRIIRGEKNAWVTLTLGLVVLFLSHNITTLLFLPMSLIFAVGYWWIERQRRRAAQLKHQKSGQMLTTRSFFDVMKIFPISLVLSYSLAIGVAAFYLFPAFLEKDLTKVNVIFGGYFHYSKHFLYLRQLITPYWGYGGSEPGPQDGLSFFLGYGHWLGLGVALILAAKFILKRWQNRVTRTFQLSIVLPWQIQLFFLFVFEAIFAAFMTLEKSTWIWDHLPFMVAVQFPWRWLSVVDVFFALVVGSTMLFISSHVRRYIYCVVLSAVILFTTAPYFRPENLDDVSIAFYYSDTYRIRHDMSKTLNDYIPIQMKQLPVSKELPPVDEPYTVTGGNEKNVKILVDHVQEKLLQTDFKEPGRIEFSVANFPGWVVLLDNQIISTKEAPLGNIVVEVPSGSHTVGVQLRETPIRFWSDSASATSLVILLSLLLWQQKKKIQRVIL